MTHVRPAKCDNHFINKQTDKRHGLCYEKTYCTISPSNCPGEFRKGGNMVTVPWPQSCVCPPPDTRAVCVSLPEGPWFPAVFTCRPRPETPPDWHFDKKHWVCPRGRDTITRFSMPALHSI